MYRIIIMFHNYCKTPSGSDPDGVFSYNLGVAPGAAIAASACGE